MKVVSDEGCCALTYFIMNEATCVKRHKADVCVCSMLTAQLEGLSSLR